MRRNAGCLAIALLVSSPATGADAEVVREVTAAELDGAPIDIEPSGSGLLVLTRTRIYRASIDPAGAISTPQPLAEAPPGAVWRVLPPDGGGALAVEAGESVLAAHLWSEAASGFVLRLTPSDVRDAIQRVVPLPRATGLLVLAGRDSAPEGGRWTEWLPGRVGPGGVRSREPVERELDPVLDPFGTVLGERRESRFAGWTDDGAWRLATRDLEPIAAGRRVLLGLSRDDSSALRVVRDGARDRELALDMEVRGAALSPNGFRAVAWSRKGVLKSLDLDSAGAHHPPVDPPQGAACQTSVHIQDDGTVTAAYARDAPSANGTGGWVLQARAGVVLWQHPVRTAFPSSSLPEVVPLASGLVAVRVLEGIQFLRAPAP